MRPILFILASLPLAGCVGMPAASLEPAAESSSSDPPSAPPAPAPTPSPEPAGPAPRPAPAPEGDGANASDPAPAASPRVVVVEAEVATVASVGHPCADQVYPPCGRGPSEPASLVVAEGAPAAARLTVWWNATAPAGTVRWVEIRDEETVLAAAEGESPLVLTLPVERLGAPVELSARITAAPGGVAVEEAAHLVLELEYR